MLAATVMSAPPSIDAYDAQMLDFPSDPDVPMNIQTSAEFFTESLMDHDGHHLVASTYAEHASVEVDMEEYIGDNAEYEMADETADYQRPHGDELLDVEVYDASHAPSPLVPPQPLQPSSDVPIESEHIPQVFSDSAHPHLQAEPELEVPPDYPAADIPHEEPAAPAVGISLDVEKEAVAELTHPAKPSGESLPPPSESYEQPEGAVHVSGQPFETLVPADAESESHVHTSAEEHPSSEGAQHENSELLITQSASLLGVEDAYDSGPPVPEEKAVDQVPATEGEVVDPHQITDGVYFDPPPAVLLSIADSSEPEFSLFNQPEAEPESSEAAHDKQKVYSLLLESRPTLYYEPLSNVFEALRQDEELLSRIPHSFEGELVLDAYDLQLVVSEDNVHSRDIGLHDLNVLHDGSDFAGPLRLRLRAIVPRFIIRYYALQEQVQRLNLAVETGEGEHYEAEQHEHYDTPEELQHQEEDYHPPTEIPAEPLEAPSSTAAEEHAEESVPPVPTEEPREEEDSAAAQEPAAEYHEVAGEATHALEDEDDYVGTNVGDEDESAKSEILDADQVHDVAAEDTDAPATVTGQELEFGGEQTEYLDYVQSEEYDERYGEDLPERAGGASPVQYGEAPHYEEEGEQDTSTAVDETQAIFPGSDEEQQVEGGATPMPPPALLEPETSQPVHEEPSSESVAGTQEKAGTSRDHSTRESTAGATHDTEDSQEISKADIDIFREIDESDSNFVALLEREADAEFDRSFDADKSGQEGSVEDVLKNDETWDEWDDEDAEGEDEEGWVDPDVASNESSVTLSSKASSKRVHAEVEPGEEEYTEDPQNSPGSKRPRVQ